MFLLLTIHLKCFLLGKIVKWASLNLSFRCLIGCRGVQWVKIKYGLK